MKSWVIALTRTVTVAVGATGVVGLALIEVDIWNARWWQKITIISALGTATVAEPLRGWYEERRGAKTRGFRARLQKALLDAVVDIATETHHDVRSVGVSAWIVRPGSAWIVRPARPPHLERLKRERLIDHPHPSKITWTKGKGVIGPCWEHERWQHRDLRPVIQKWSESGKLTPERYEKVDSDTRLGMTLQEFRTMLGKYDEVAAEPITDEDGNFLGCIAVDVTAGSCSGTPGALTLDSTGVKQVAATTARVVAGILKQR